MGDEPASLSKSDLRWAKSIGNVAAPLLAGFSLTAVIAISEDAGKFRWADAAIPSLAVAAVTLIAAVQLAKGVHKEDLKKVRRCGQAYIAYHAGLVALMLGLGFALAPLHVVGSPAGPRWAACGIALAAATGQFIASAFGERNWCNSISKAWRNR